jgi:predicted nucleic acid-binding protein
MNAKIFVDTNILLYAHDIDAGRKHQIAVEIIKELWETRLGVLSTQVLQEFYVNVTRKIPYPLSSMEAREIIREYFVWQVEETTVNSILRASELEERHNISFWDALIVVAAWQANVSKILTEDLNPGQLIEGILIENPFN